MYYRGGLDTDVYGVRGRGTADSVRAEWRRPPRLPGHRPRRRGPALVDTWVHHVEAVWDFPDYARFLRRLSSFGRMIHFDRRGTGLSDPVPLDQLPDLQTQVVDAVAVLEAAGSTGAAVIGLNDGTIVAVLLGASRPDLCRSLVLFAFTGAHRLPTDLPMESFDEVIKMIEARAATDESGVELLAPSRAGDERFDRQLARLQRHSVRPGAFGHYYRQTIEVDISDVLPSIRTPTLVLNRTGNRIVPVEQSREAAGAIEAPGSWSCGAPTIWRSRRASTHSSTRSRSSSPGCGPEPIPTGCSRRCSSPTSSTPPPWRRGSGIADGATYSISTTGSDAGSSSGSAGARSRRPATGSSPRSI